MRWWLVGDAPEHAQPLDGVEEFLEVDRLDHEGIHAQFEGWQGIVTNTARSSLTG